MMLVAMFDRWGIGTGRVTAASALQLSAMFLLVFVVGCGGCNRDVADEDLLKKKKETEKALQVFKMQALPVDHEQSIVTAKPGHWYETRQEFKSNREDLQVVVEGSIRRGKDLVPVPGTDMLNTYTRRTSLPKGQTRSVELQFFVPPAAIAANEDPFAFESTALRFETTLLSYPLMTPLLSAPETEPARELKPHEYQLIVLSPEAQSYAQLAAQDMVLWNSDELMSAERTRSYYVSLLKPRSGRYPIGKSLLTMTATAAIFWDDVSEDDLSVAQKQAIVDWVHWGGQLVISGPTSWTRIRSSFLSDLLPVQEATSAPLDTSAFDAISENFVVRDFGRGSTPNLEIVGEAISGMEFTLAPGGSWVPKTGELVAERQVGRGRIVMTAFPMREPQVFSWRYFSSFASTALLRRPPRKAARDRVERMLSQYWAGSMQGNETDARLNSNVRILSRDLPLAVNGSQAAAGAVATANQPGLATATAVNGYAQPSTLAQSNNVDAEIARAEEQTSSEGEDSSSAPVLNLPESGLPGREAIAWGKNSAAWNDFSAVSYQAVNALTSAAGIDLPSRKTILYLLGGYLFCLVPLNWAFFKLIGRLEYAWIAAPILAIVGVAAVTRIARLDIGFARRSTEIGVLELHGDHPRGHLTQYVALYTSLSTNYTVHIPEDGSVALPLAELSSVSRRTSSFTQMKTNFGRSEGVSISPLTVLSNSTERVHAEQMLSLPGSLSLGQRETGQDALRNDTGKDLRSALILRRESGSAVEYCYLDELTTGQVVTLDYVAVEGENLWESWNKSPVTGSAAPSQEELSDADEPLWLGGVMQSIVRKTPLAEGQVLLVGFTEQRVGAMELSPSQDQFDSRCVVVAHLRPGRLPVVVPDRSILSRIQSRDSGPPPTEPGPPPK